jgi:ferric-dicitrate binding protein FerR (iron transport regulator)
MSPKDKSIIPVDLISLFLSGEAKAKDLSALEEWKALSPDNLKIFNEYSSLWEKSRNIREIAEIDIEKELSLFHSRVSSTGTTKLRRISPLLRMAAAILSGLIIGYSIMATYQAVKFDKAVAKSAIAEVNLPDGSAVTLNIGSSLKWPKEFKGETREVKLEGEAFFEVSRDSLKPFIASSGKLVVEVLGTAFNIQNIKNSVANVIVEEGRVAVYVLNQKESAEYLTRGEKVSLTSDQQGLIKAANTNPNFNAWKTKKVVFNNSTMQEVAVTLSKVYNKNITANNYSGDESITVTFENNDLEYILNTIKATLDVTIKETKSGIEIN